MKVTACLCWFDETPAVLERCVSSLAGIADELVAFDGAWELFPAEAPASHDEQRLAIRAAARFPVVIKTPDTIWTSQVEKRSQLMRHAAERGADWLIVIDADEHIDCPQPELVRAALARTLADVAAINCQQWIEGRRSGSTYPIRRMYRASTGVTVEQAHNGYRTSDGRWLHGDPTRVELEPFEDLSDLIKLAHDTTARTDERQRARRIYRARRRTAMVEAWA